MPTNTFPTNASPILKEQKIFTPYQYGAVGDGVTDDTNAFLLMKRDIEASVALSGFIEGRYQAEISLGIGRFVISGADPIFPSAGSPRPWGLVVRGVSEDASQIRYAPTGTEPCLYRPLAGGSCRSKFSNFSIICTNAHPRAAGFITTADGTGGSQADLFEGIAFQDIPHGIIADGSNLNSERTYRRLTFSGTGNLVGVWLRGLPTGQSGGDQFVNNWFQDISFTVSYGTLLAARYGGSISMLGGNWIHTAQNAGTACGSPVFVNAQCASGAMPLIRVPTGTYDSKTGMTLAYAQTGQSQATNADLTILSAANVTAPTATNAAVQMSNQTIGYVGPSIQVAVVPTSGVASISLKIVSGGTSHTLKRGDMIKVNSDSESNYWVTTDATLDTTGVLVSVTPEIGTTLSAVNTVVECVSAAYIVLQNTTHASGTPFFMANAIRAEHRTRDSRLIDCEWGGGSIQFINCADTVNAFNVGPFATSTFRFSNEGGPSIRWIGGEVHGGHLYCFDINGWQTRNSITYEGIRFSHAAEPGQNLWQYGGRGLFRQTHSNSGGTPVIRLTSCRTTNVTDQFVGSFTLFAGSQHRQFESVTNRAHMNGVYGSLNASDSVTIILPRHQIVTRIFGWMPASSGVTGTSPTWTLTNGNAVTLATAAPATAPAGFLVDITTPYETGTDLATRTLTLTSNAAISGSTNKWRWFVEF